MKSRTVTVPRHRCSLAHSKKPPVFDWSQMIAVTRDIGIELTAPGHLARTPRLAKLSAEPQARQAVDDSTTIDMRLAYASMARRVRNDDYTSATHRD
jgi:hypothetical protein